MLITGFPLFLGHSVCSNTGVVGSFPFRSLMYVGMSAYFLNLYKPSKLTQAVMLMICVWEVPVSNADLNTDCPV
jgi:hypothetical protein